MKIRIHTPIAFLILLASLSDVYPQNGRQITALVGGTLIDGFGSTPIRNSVILIDGDRIKAVGQIGVVDVPEGAEVISTEGMSVLPGLWDMHVHLMTSSRSKGMFYGTSICCKMGIW